MHRWNETLLSVFLVDVHGDQARLRAKPAFFDDDAMAGDHVYAHRARLYEAHFRQALAHRPVEGGATLALDVSDFPVVSRDAPILSFQKPRFAANILIPDIDFLYFAYEAETDLIAFQDKRPGAVFVGASTGGTVTRDAVAHGLLPRLAIARRFAGHPSISVSIGAAVQCDSDDTRSLLEGQPWFSGPIEWSDQLKRRFILSIDGNGATCSRVVRTLASNSVLIKMNSPHQLFYFAGLRPFEHYLPAADAEAVEDWVRLDGLGRIDRAGIIARANAFASTLLTREAVLTYTSMVIETCARRFM
jgi:hypothetical protein